MIVTVNDFLLPQETEYIDHEKYFSILAAVTCGYIFYATARI